MMESLEARLLLSGLEATIEAPQTADEGDLLSLSTVVTGATGTLSYDWSVTKDGVPYDLGSQTASTLDFAPADDGQYDVFLTVTDSDGGGGEPIGLTNGTFSGEVFDPWQVGGDGIGEILNGQLHLRATNTYQWFNGAWQAVTEQGMGAVYLEVESDGQVAPDGTTGITFDAVVTVEGAPEGYTGAWVMTYVTFYDSGGETALLTELPDGTAGQVPLTLDDLVNTGYIELVLFTEIYPDLPDPVGDDPLFRSISVDVLLDNFVWEGTSGGGTGATAEASAAITVANVAPTSGVSAPAEGLRGEPVSITLEAGDPSPADQAADFIFQIDWGDGTTETVTGASGQTRAHTYDALGAVTASVVAIDKDGDAGAAAETSVEIVPALIRDGGLVVAGSAGGDSIWVSTGSTIVVAIDEDGDGVADWSGTFDEAMVTKIVVYGGDGDDQIVVDSGVAVPVELYGGAGNDRLEGGAGSDLLDGGDGNDMLIGGGGDNWLYGGAGNDALYGGSGHNVIYGGDGNDAIAGAGGSDIIFGGSGIDLISGGSGNDFIVGGDGTDILLGNAGHDILVAGEVDPSYTVDDLRAILADWVSQRDPDEGLVDGEQEPVSDDNFDVLAGGTGSDWFIVSHGDWVLDFRFNWAQRDLITYV